MPARDRTTLDLFAADVSRRDPAGAQEIAPAACSDASAPIALRAVPPPSSLQGSGRVRELWLAVSLPALALEALTAADEADPAGPLAVVDLDAGGRQVAACNAAAARLGVVPGLGLNAAHALVHDLAVRARDRGRERSLLERLAECAGVFTPRVSLEPPNALLLEVQGSLRLFGGVQSLSERVSRWLTAAGVTATLALAPTPLASLWLARTHGGPGAAVRVLKSSELSARLATVPLTALRWPETAFLDLQAMGVETVGDCLRLPRDGFARRFGPALLGELDRALGRAADPRRVCMPRQRYVEVQDLDHELEQTARLLPVLERLVQSFADFLEARQACVRGFVVMLVHRDSPPTRIAIRLVAPTADAAHFMTLLANRLERLTLPAPVRRLRLRSDFLLPLEAAHAAMADTTGPFAAALRAADDVQPAASRRAVRRRGVSCRIPRLVERLRARLGVDAVHGLCLVPEHRPERASRAAEPMIAMRRTPGGGEAASTAPDSRTVRPLWLLSQPQPLEAGRGWPYYEGRLTLEQGPERIETGWWDGSDVARDYYVALSPAGLRLWVYRERRASRRWFLHGVFA